MAKKTIKIACDGTRYIPLGAIEFFQGNLKDVTRSDIDRIKRMLIADGLCSPLFLWEGRAVSLDGHQRTMALRELVSEGWEIPDLPAVNIIASSEADAAKKVLIYNSKYAKITDDGLYEFLKTNDIALSDISTDIQLNDIDMEKFLKGWGEDDGDQGQPSGVENNYAEQYGVMVICESESHQAEVYDMLKKKGYNLKVVNT